MAAGNEKAEDQPDYHCEDDSRYGFVPRIRRAPRFRRAIGSLDRLEDRCDTGLDSRRNIARTEARDNLISNDVGGAEIRQGAFEAIPDFDADFFLFEGDEQQHAVVSPLLSQLPGGGDAMGPFFEWLAFERGEHEHRDLIAGLGFVRSEVAGECGSHLCRQDMGEVHHTPGQRGHIEGPGQSRAQEHRKKDKEPRRLAPDTAHVGDRHRDSTRFS